MKPYQNRQTNNNYQEKVKKFNDESQRLFDISSCKCKLISNCRCEQKCRVPKNEINFLIDQRTTRKMMIGGVDIIACIKAMKKQGRKEKFYLRNNK